jgi:endonuclease/exonuclease/phosphatase family metal-dependent hydrolase
MRKFYLVFAAFIILLFSACPPVTPVTLSSDAYFESFTFLQSLNGGLDKDYEASWNAGRNAWVAGSLPAATDVSVITPVFKAVNNAKVFVNGVEVHSGSSYFDFSAPVVFTIKAEDGSEKTWAVTLDKLAPLPSSITVMSYNVEDFYRESTNRHEAIAQLMKSMSVEVAVLCEVQANGSNPGSTQDDVSLLKTALSNIGWAMPYSCFADDYYDDIVIISKYPIKTSEEILPPGGSATWPRAGIKAVIEISDGTTTKDYTVMGFHLKAMEDGIQKRIDQAKALADYFRATYSASTLSTGYFIVAGDMNTFTVGDRSPAETCTLGYLRLLDDADATNNFTAVNEALLPTTATHQLGSVLDHIILSPALYAKYQSGTITVKATDTDFDMTKLSDHYPVLLELDL